MTKILTYIKYVTVFIALLIISDFFITNTPVIEVVTDTKTTYQSYNNAGGNSHVSKAIKTNSFLFNCSDSFFEKADINDKILVKTGYLFNSVNSYTLVKKQLTETYSLRYLTGLILPILALITLSLSFKLKQNTSILLVTTQIAIGVDLVFLLFFS